jgi:hypothetical protein
MGLNLFHKDDKTELITPNQSSSSSNDTDKINMSSSSD